MHLQKTWLRTSIIAVVIALLFIPFVGNAIPRVDENGNFFAAKDPLSPTSRLILQWSFGILALLALAGIVVSLILLIMAKKNKRYQKPGRIIFGISLIVFILALIAFASASFVVS